MSGSRSPAFPRKLSEDVLSSLNLVLSVKLHSFRNSPPDKLLVHLPINDRRRIFILMLVDKDCVRYQVIASFKLNCGCCGWRQYCVAEGCGFFAEGEFSKYCSQLTCNDKFQVLCEVYRGKKYMGEDLFDIGDGVSAAGLKFGGFAYQQLQGFSYSLFVIPFVPQPPSFSESVEQLTFNEYEAQPPCQRNRTAIEDRYEKSISPDHMAKLKARTAASVVDHNNRRQAKEISRIILVGTLTNSGDTITGIENNNPQEKVYQKVEEKRSTTRNANKEKARKEQERKAFLAQVAAAEKYALELAKKKAAQKKAKAAAKPAAKSVA